MMLCFFIKKSLNLIFLSFFGSEFVGYVDLPGKMCLVTEFMQLGSLAGVLLTAKEPPLPFPLKIKMALECARGMAFLHGNGVINRLESIECISLILFWH